MPSKSRISSQNNDPLLLRKHRSKSKAFVFQAGDDDHVTMLHCNNFISIRANDLCRFIIFDGCSHGGVAFADDVIIYSVLQIGFVSWAAVSANHGPTWQKAIFKKEKGDAMLLLMYWSGIQSWLAGEHAVLCKAWCFAKCFPSPCPSFLCTGITDAFEASW